MSEWIETRFPGYFVSAEGQVLGRFGRVLKPGKSGTRGDYLLVQCGRKNSQSVHRLVAEAFLGPCPEGMEVAHANGNGHDNRAINLSYKTHKENDADKDAHGTRNPGRVPGEQNGRAKLTDELVLEIRSRPAPHNKSALAREFNVSRPVIAGVLTRKNWKHI